MRIFIEPAESLTFRTGHPFEAGEGNFAQSIFPPTPETLQGALRATIAAYWNPEQNIADSFNDPKLTTLIGDRDSYQCFRITSIALGRYEEATPGKVELLFPPPMHIICDEDGKGKLLRIKPQIMKDVQTNLPDGLSHLLIPDGRYYGKLKPLEGWLSQTSLELALRPDGDLTKLKMTKNSEIYEYESRLGIGMNTTSKQTLDGFLYQQQMIRMRKNYGFAVDIHLSTTPDALTLRDAAQTKEKLSHLPDSGWMTIGGEQRAAHYRILKDAIEGGDRQDRTGRLLYLATPAYFEKSAWRPSDKFAPLNKPIAAVVHRPELIGGWRLNPGNAKGDQKSIHRCVPAGSVYFFEKPITVTSPLTDYGMEIGYGISFTGEW